MRSIAALTSSAKSRAGHTERLILLQNASVRSKWTPPMSTDVELTDRKATIIPRKEENDVDLTIWACNAFGVGTGGV